jgi:rhodanese-related sulfurtransferase
MNQQASAIPQVDVLYTDIRRRDPVRPAVVVDVREPNEIAEVRVEGTVRIPFSEIGTRFEELPRDRPLLIMCASGSRSAAVTNHLLQNGWTDVANVAGGIIAWERAGLPVDRG